MRKPWYSYLYVRSPIAKIGLAILSLLATMVLILFQMVIENPRMEAQTASWDGRSIETGASLYRANCSSCHGLEGMGLPNVAPAVNSRYFFTQRLADVGFAGTTAQYVELTIASGRPSKINSQWAAVMPTWHTSYGGPLRDDQVKHLRNFVMNWEEGALKQTAETDPWQFFDDAPSAGSPYGETAEADEAEAEAAEGSVRPPQEVFVSSGCIGCHNLDEDQTADNVGQPGPYVGNLWETASSHGTDAETYVYTSIVDPNAEVVSGYIPNLMPQNFADQLSEEEIDSLVTWLLDPNRER